MTGPQFQALRNSLGLTQSVLAERFGVSQSQIRNLEASAGDIRHVYALALERIATERVTADLYALLGLLRIDPVEGH